MVRIPWYARSMGFEEKRGKSKLRLRRRGIDSVDIRKRQAVPLEEDSDSAESADDADDADDSDDDDDDAVQAPSPQGGQKAVESGQVGAPPPFGRKEEEDDDDKAGPPPPSQAASTTTDEPPSPTTTTSQSSPPPPPTTTSNASQIVDGVRTLSIQTPETHSSRPIPTNPANPSPNAPPAASTTASTATSSPPASSQSSLQSSSVSSALSSQSRAAPSSTFATRTSSSTPQQALLPSSVTSIQQSRTINPTLVQAGETSSSLTSAETETPTALPANFADNKGIQSTKSSSSSRNAGIIIGVIAGAVALLLLTWFLVRKITRLRKERHEKDKIQPSPTEGRQSKIWDAATTVAPRTVTEPSVHPSHFPAPPFSPRRAEHLDASGEAVNGLEVHPSNLAMGAGPLAPPPAAKVPAENQPSRWNNWRNSVASVPRFRTIKSWVGDQSRRNDSGEVPEMPKGMGKWEKLEDDKTVVGSELGNRVRDSAFRSESDWTSVSQR